MGGLESKLGSLVSSRVSLDNEVPELVGGREVSWDSLGANVVV